MASVKQIFSKFISEKIPKKQTNIFWMLFNGIDTVLSQLELMIKIYKRENNILTAISIIGLRNLSAKNGFEPKLKIPSKGILYMKVNPKLFNRVGFPLYLPPYSILTNKNSKLLYYYNSNKTLKIENDVLFIPVIEGELLTQNHISTGNYIERIYINTDSIAENSVSISIGNDVFTEVKSFFDKENLYDDKQFLIKYSNKPDTPLIIYIKGTKLNDIINVTYRLTSGEFGNIDYKANFETEDIINSQGDVVSIADDEIEIYNKSGFNFGSNGTDINSLRSAIGFNHGINLLFDTISYRDYINKFSNVLLQKIDLSNNHKAIKNIYISKKQYINIELSNLIKEQYQKIIDLKMYQFSDIDLENLDNSISENEFALSSHNLYNSETNKFAIQLMFNNQYELDKHSFEIQTLIYNNFSKFLYDKNLQLNFELLFNDFMFEKNTFFDYSIFNELIEKDKLFNKKEISTPYIIKHENYLPILKGDFDISDNLYNPIKLFFDINIVSKDNISI
jgi:hypothetical protein